MIFKQDKATKGKGWHQLQGKGIGAIAILTTIILLGAIEPAMAHHGMGGKIPNNLWEGFLSGIGHPIIGIDHLAFIIAIGLIAARTPKGILIPVSFLATAMLGTGIHLLSIDLPLPEIAIALSVVVFGAMLALKQKLNTPTPLLASLAAIAGIFHGYAYGEAIIGAEMTPLLAYLAGFTAIQLLVASAGMKFAELIGHQWQNQFFSFMRFFGLVISAIGAVFFTSALAS